MDRGPFEISLTRLTVVWARWRRFVVEAAPRGPFEGIEVRLGSLGPVGDEFGSNHPCRGVLLLTLY